MVSGITNYPFTDTNAVNAQAFYRAIVNPAMTTPVVKRTTEPTRGGIDFAGSNLDLQIKRDGKGMVLPMSQQNLDNIHIDGLVPVILNIKPVQNVPLFSKMIEEDRLTASS